MVFRLRKLVGRAWDASFWRPSHLRLIHDQVLHRRRNEIDGHSDDDHLLASAQWLCRAQDAASDGGVMGRYRLHGGWTSSYPETTGYIIPTFLRLAELLKDPSYTDRARRCVDFLMALQLDSGAFPGGELHERRTGPSIFNSAQIVHGLIAWHAATGDRGTRDAAIRTGDWLVEQMDPDGAWRRHVHNGHVTSYTAHASCWLAELGQGVGKKEFLDAAGRHLDWVLSLQDEQTGWFDLAGFTPAHHSARQAVTHTIAYTLWGVLTSSVILGREDGLVAVKRAAQGIARRLELSHWLPGELDYAWRGRANYSCLTGNAQMALVWFKLYQQDRDPRWLNPAFKALDLVKRSQPMTNPDPGIRGGIPGSDPAWGGYLYMSFPNWAAKFFIDALMTRREIVAAGVGPTSDRAEAPPDIPTRLGEPGPAVGAAPLRVVLYTRPGSTKLAEMLDAWCGGWGFKPAAIVVEDTAEPSARKRLGTVLREEGLGGIPRRLRRRPMPTHGRNDLAGSPSTDVFEVCRRYSLPVIRVGSLESEESLQVIRDLRPDLAVHAGAGILRPPLLAVPRLGTLNAHMGILPHYRGMNVAEWAVLRGGPVGCTVHCVDAGIDTGDILCVRMVPTDRLRSIAQVRDRVNQAQVALLGEVLRWVIASGTLPARRSQKFAEGTQYFRMHPSLAIQVESRLQSAPGSEV